MALQTFLLPVCYAVFIWWFTTGLIIAVYGRSQWLMRLCFGGVTVAMVVALLGLVAVRDQATALHVYIAVTCGVVIWGWQTAGYYLGFVTGPHDKERLILVDDSWAARFRAALHFGIYHELVALAFGILIALITWQSPNHWGLWIYVALWLMHTSAKLNVFFGVRNFNIELLPPHLHPLKEVLKYQASNPFFPVSVAVAITAALTLLYRGIVPDTTIAETAGFLMVATMITLGVLEHLLLVLSLPATVWGWGMRAMPTHHDQPPGRTLKTTALPATIKGYADDD